MRVDVVERLPKHGAATGEAAEDASVKQALQNFQSAMQGDDSLFVSEYRGNSRSSRAALGAGPGTFAAGAAIYVPPFAASDFTEEWLKQFTEADGELASGGSCS